MALSIKARKLTRSGALMGGLIALLLFAGTGWMGIILMALFFALAVAATAWKKEWKENRGVAEKNKGRRNAGQVLANAGLAACFGLMIVLFPSFAIQLKVMIAACFSSATADTLSSELGTVFGKKFYHILSLQKDQRGLDGVVSLEGLLIGVFGSAIIALAFGSCMHDQRFFLTVLIAGTIGNLADSVLGAALERKGKLGNNAINFINTLVAALVVLLYSLK
ncbi:MAG: DUF92 domain-containing protein [Flavisolibacter sp.]